MTTQVTHSFYRLVHWAGPGSAGSAVRMHMSSGHKRCQPGDSRHGSQVPVPDAQRRLEVVIRDCHGIEDFGIDGLIFQVNHVHLLADAL